MTKCEFKCDFCGNTVKQLRLIELTSTDPYDSDDLVNKAFGTDWKDENPIDVRDREFIADVCEDCLKDLSKMLNNMERGF